MKDHSMILPLAVALLALFVSALAWNAALNPPHPAMLATHQIQKPSRYTWASLGDETIQLGTALEHTPPGKATIFCAASSCHDLALDIDDAMQVAGWQSNIEERPVDSESEDGISVGPPGTDAEAFAERLKEVTGIEPHIVAIDGVDGIGIIIGKTDRK
jgi:hypothetical protein